ncbi:hypothetical protein, partial [Streptomyces sp. Ru71]|uniref:hypothetical protein n=1 Tax=Streptomyces sp. Ru71 TaxID=2080746 RepID=UPI001CA5B277
MSNEDMPPAGEAELPLIHEDLAAALTVQGEGGTRALMGLRGIGTVTSGCGFGDPPVRKSCAGIRAGAGPDTRFCAVHHLMQVSPSGGVSGVASIDERSN